MISQRPVSATTVAQPVHPQGFPPPQQQVYPPQSWAHQQPYQQPGANQPHPTWVQGQPPKKKSPLKTIVFGCLLLFIAIPVIVGIIATQDKQTYQPPPLPPVTEEPQSPSAPANNRPRYPVSEEKAQDIVRNNSLYTLTVPPASCSTPAVDLVNSSASVIEQQMEETLDCLMEIWSDVVKYDDHSLRRPDLVFHEEEVTGSCGIITTHVAHYCSANNTIYFPRAFIIGFSPQVQKARYAFDDEFAHEFGHAIQDHTMIMDAEYYLRNHADSPSEALESQRRLEIQAQCFSGLTLNSLGYNTQDRAGVEQVYREYMDSPPYEGDHGTNANFTGWGRQGLSSNTPLTCNTFVASSEYVS
jgi:predicted metalloprotease